LSAIAADFEPAHHDVETTIALDLSFETVEQIALEFGDFAAPQASHVNVITLRPTLIEVFFSLQVHEVQFVYQTMTLQQAERSVNRNAIDLGIDLAGFAQNLAGIEMLLGGLDDTQDSPALPRHAQSAGVAWGQNPDYCNTVAIMS
jgi:hypothetical protein